MIKDRSADLSFFYLHYMNISPYVYLDDPAQKGAVLILNTSAPFPIGQVWRFRSESELQEFLSRGADLPYAAVEGYYAVITLSGCLAARFYGGITETRQELQEMARFLINSRITRDKSYWQRYARKSL